MSYKVIYAGNPLHDYMDIHSIERTILPTRENSSKQIPSMHGSYFMSYKYGEKYIKLSCSIKASDKEDFVETVRELAFLLDIKSPQRLILGDSPETFYYAILDGDTSIERISNIGKFELNFICHNPFEYAVKSKTTERSAIRLVGDVWVETMDDTSDVEDGEIDDGYTGDETEPGEGDDDIINYESDEFAYGFMENYDEDYEPKEEEDFVEEEVDEETDMRNRVDTNALIESHVRSRVKEDLNDKEYSDEIDYEIEPNLNDKEYNYEEIMRNSIPLVWTEDEVHRKIRELEKQELENELNSRAPIAKAVTTVESNTHKLFLSNAGSVPTYPIISVQFSEKAHYFQCSNHRGTLLVGVPPTLEKPSVAPSPVVLNDTCKTLNNWVTVGNVIDTGIVTGSLGINPNGYAITCANYGSDSDKWHGAGARRNLTRQVENFRVEVSMEHESSGNLSKISNATVNIDSSTGKPTSSADGWYIVDIKSGTINHRKGRGKNTTLVQKVPKGKKLKISSISNKWGRCTYNGKTGYVYMSYLKKTSAPSTTSSSSGGYYKTNIRINHRKGRGIKYSILQKIAKGKKVKVSSIKNGWGYVSYNGKKGYVYMKNLKKSTSSSKARADGYSDTETKEDRMGRIEFYGFDNLGNKLFKCVMRDSSSYYEYSEPEIFIGSKLVMSDGKATPTPKSKKVIENSKSTTYKIDSGSYGDWNSFDGKFIVERRTNSKGEQQWKCKVEKYSNGKVVKTLPLQTFVNSSYPTGKLASIVIWFGQYQNHKVVDVQNITHIKVTDLTPESKEEVNVPIFQKGDELEIDFEEQTVELNGKNFLTHLDIGSEFFEIPAGQSEIICRSDTKKMNADAVYRERWI